MSKIDDGGPMFPPSSVVHEWEDGKGEHREIETTHGISLRDFFAGLAMVSYEIADTLQDVTASADDRGGVRHISAEAYRQADAMIAHKRKSEAADEQG